MDLSDQQIAHVMDLLGLEPEMFAAVHVAGPVAGPAMISAIKVQSKRRYRKLVLEYHPDRTGNDPEKTEVFKAITEVMSEIADLRYTPSLRSYPWAKIFQIRREIST